MDQQQRCQIENHTFFMDFLTSALVPSKKTFTDFKYISDFVLQCLSGCALGLLSWNEISIYCVTVSLYVLNASIFVTAITTGLNEMYFST